MAPESSAEDWWLLVAFALVGGLRWVQALVRREPLDGEASVGLLLLIFALVEIVRELWARIRKAPPQLLVALAAAGAVFVIAPARFTGGL